MSASTLVTFLGKGREDRQTGYRTATYRFPDGSERKTAFFGLALAEHLDADTVVILGTSGSQWGVMVENLASEGEEEDKRIHLMEAEATATVDQTMLDDLADIMSRAAGRTVLPRLIPFGKDADEQYRILDTVADSVPNGNVNFDVTHGFRHLGMIGFLSTFMLERVRRLDVRGLWYGALDMTDRTTHITPVLQLDGLSRVQRWIDALARFDATGDYGVFAPLLIEDSVPEDKVRCLERAAFYERISNDRDAKRSLDTFLPVLKDRLAGASGLFQDRLEDKLAWAKATPRSERQRRLAMTYLEREDFVRAAVFGLEAQVARECETRQRDPDRPRDREEVKGEMQKSLTGEWHTAYTTLNALRNAMVHGTRPRQHEYETLLSDHEQLRGTLRGAINRLLPVKAEA